METMKALVIYQNGDAAIKRVPVPEYGSHEALVRMQASALCGTDIKILHDDLKCFRSYPTILGHEGVGKVIAVGDRVQKFKVGDSVVLPFIPRKCGEYYSTWGAISEYAIVGDSEAMKRDGIAFDEGLLAQRVIPSSIDPVAATMIVTFREILSTMLRLGFHSGQNIVIYGVGPVGLAFIRLAKILGMGPVISVIRRESKAIQALEAGADHIINSSTSDVIAEVRKLLPDGADILLDAAGAPDLIDTNLKIVREYGDICIYGVLPGGKVTIDWREAPYSFNLRFAQWPSKREEAAVHDRVIDMMQNGTLNGMDYISDVFSLDDAVQAIDCFKAHRNKKKIVIRMDGQ